ncbi:MAG: hypothetical protein DLM70_09030 [Chloroflexi bacterium]|nr:MAG: hypothetical protein DLM70_09030 [Chloroflexota bacterium]
MIVRISGSGQYELRDDLAHRLDVMDGRLTSALHEHREADFHQLLAEAIDFVQTSGEPVAHERIVSSDVIIPPEDVTLPEAQSFFNGERLVRSQPT